MLVKIDRYRVRPDQIEQHQTLQARARALYRKYFQDPVLFLRSQDDPCQWVSIHWYPDEETYHRRMTLINAEPESVSLWEAFRAILDPRTPFIQEEYYDQIDARNLVMNP
ncbi:MAG: hypothetical protein HXY41_02115 [Chloroflexi bacterium]|nr:hypothetical protein [Chloroflexota bacterium]